MSDRIEEIAMALGGDQPSRNPYKEGTIEHGIYELRRENQRLRENCPPDKHWWSYPASWCTPFKK